MYLEFCTRKYVLCFTFLFIENYVFVRMLQYTCILSRETLHRDRTEMPFWQSISAYTFSTALWQSKRTLALFFL